MEERLRSWRRAGHAWPGTGGTRLATHAPAAAPRPTRVWAQGARPPRPLRQAAGPGPRCENALSRRPHLLHFDGLGASLLHRGLPQVRVAVLERNPEPVSARHSTVHCAKAALSERARLHVVVLCGVAALRDGVVLAPVERGRGGGARSVCMRRRSCHCDPCRVLSLWVEWHCLARRVRVQGCLRR